MKLKLLLVQNGKVIFQMPLSPSDWQKETLQDEFDSMEEDLQKFSRIFDALSHETRLRMMRRLVQEENRTLSFADFMRDLNLNPKIVWENSRKLTEGGLLIKTSRGKYSCSESGQMAFMMMSLALHRLIDAMEELESH